MFKMTLLVYLTMSTGQDYARQFTVTVESEEQCKEMGREVISNPDIKKNPKFLRGTFFCTDKRPLVTDIHIPVPKNIPFPKRRPL